MRFLENFDQNKKIYETISTKVDIFLKIPNKTKILR